MQTLATAATCHPAPRPTRRLLRQMLAALGRALERQRTRRALALLDDAALRDIGLSRAEARRESAKPFWR